MKIITTTIFLIVFVGSIIQFIAATTIYVTGISLFTVGVSGAILLGAILKYYSQEQRDKREIKKEQAKLSKHSLSVAKK